MPNAVSTPLQAGYQRASLLEPRILNTPATKLTLNATLYPCWIENSDCCWYERETPNGKDYRLVNAQTASNSRAFDHQALADALTEASGEAVAANDLPLNDLVITLSPTRLFFSAFNTHWQFDNDSGDLQPVQSHPDNWRLSPNGKHAAFVRDHNVWVKDLSSGEERALTQDGEQLYAYATTPTVYGRQEMETLELRWSPDSQRIFTLARDTRQVRRAPPLVQHVPQDGSLQPRIVHKDRRVGVPGDEHVEVNVFLSIELASGDITTADYHGCPAFYPPYIGFFSSHRGWWSKDSRRAYFIELARGGLSGRLVEFDTHTGATRVVIEDPSDTHFIFIPNSHLCTLIVPLTESNEVIWYSERSGWAHLYLYDLDTATLKNPITQGEWVVRNVLHYDPARRELWIQTAGRVEHRNPYYCDVCRVNIDSGELTPVVSTDHEYTVREQRSRAGRGITTGTDGDYARGVSPSGDYMLCTRSRVDGMPVTLLFDRNGNEQLTVETAEAPGLPKGWQWPEPVMLKAADGVTDIYAVVFRPVDFSPDQSYPVVDCSWGDFTPAGAFSHSVCQGGFSFSAAALAELGFITVMISSRGTGMRSKAFFTDKESSLFFACQIPDHIAALEQLAERYPYMDLNRVGVGAHSSTSLAVAAPLKYPDFFKVGVTRNPCLDWRLSGDFVAEMYCAGVPADCDDKEELYKLAGGLKGKLLLVHGLLDDAVPVAETLRLIEAFEQANKDIDMMIMPNLGHGSSPYVIRRSWDYLVRHLQGVEPPKEFDM